MWSPWIVLAILGHGPFIASSPDPFIVFISSPSAERRTASIPRNGSVADPGLAGIAPGRGLIIMPPVSVCHQVSTTEHLPSPTVS